MTAAHRRHDIADQVWERLRPFLPGDGGKRGRPARDNRLFLNAVFWILRTGAPWRDLPPDYGDWKNTHRRFCRWRDRGVWEQLLDAVVDDPDFEWLMIDASYIKVHPHGTRVCRQNNLAQIASALIWQMARKDASFLAYRVATARHCLKSRNEFSTK